MLFHNKSFFAFLAFLSLTNSIFPNAVSQTEWKMPQDEEITIQKYIAEFPFHQYKIYTVSSVGAFYVDDVKDVIKFQLSRSTPWELPIIRILETLVKPNTIAVDIGAHIGTHTVIMSRSVQPNGKILAFEPQKKLFRELTMNLRLNRCSNVTPLRYAIGDTNNQTVEMNPPVKGNEGATSIGSGGDPVIMRTLDSFRLSNVSVMKIDVEGSEDGVLSGARDTILRNRPHIIIEIMGGYDYDNSSQDIRQRVEHTLSTLCSFNYEIRRIDVHNYLAIPKK